MGASGVKKLLFYTQGVMLVLGVQAKGKTHASSYSTYGIAKQPTHGFRWQPNKCEGEWHGR
jgi:hypothetical protein